MEHFSARLTFSGSEKKKKNLTAHISLDKGTSYRTYVVNCCVRKIAPQSMQMYNWAVQHHLPKSETNYFL